MNEETPETFFTPEEEEKYRETVAANAAAESEKKVQGKQLVIKPIDQVRGAITKLENEFAKVLPEHIKPSAFARVVITTLQNKPDLLNYNRQSLFSACMLAAQDGMLLDNKQAALVPYKGQVRYTPMVWGILKKIRNSGELSTVTINMVYEQDKFSYWVDDLGEHVKHEIDPFKDRGKKRGGYAMFLGKDGGRMIELMNMQQIAEIENISEAKKGPWNGPFREEMEKKTILRRLSKRCPMTPEVERIIQRDDDMYDFKKAEPHKIGMAAELNEEKDDKSKDSSGDKIESLRDLRGKENGPVPHKDLQSDAGGCGVEPVANVPNPSSSADGLGVAEVHQPIRTRKGSAAKKGLVVGVDRRDQAGHAP